MIEDCPRSDHELKSIPCRVHEQKLRAENKKRQNQKNAPLEASQTHSLNWSCPLRGSRVVKRHFPFWMKAVRLTQSSSPGSSGGESKRSWIYEQSQKSLLQQVCTGRRVCFTELVMFFLPEKFENMRWNKKISMSKSLLSNVNSDARTGLQPAVGI